MTSLLKTNRELASFLVFLSFFFLVNLLGQKSLKLEPVEVFGFPKSVLYPYDFSETKSFDRNLNLFYIKDLKREDFEKQVLSSVPRSLRKKLRTFLQTSLYHSQKQNIDPFWSLAVMWTESHFRKEAISHKGARGLMQLMPSTYRYMKEIHLKNHPLTLNIDSIDENIRYGNVYLKRLYNLFKGNMRYATISYNMGPGYILNKIKESKKIGTTHNYYVKVRYHYQKLIKNYFRYQKSRSREYLNTFVVKKRETQLFTYKLSLIIPKVI